MSMDFAQLEFAGVGSDHYVLVLENVKTLMSTSGFTFRHSKSHV